LSLKAQFLILGGVILLTFTLMVLFAPSNIASYVVIDVSLHTTPYRLIGKTNYDFNNASDIERLPKRIDGWGGDDFSYPKRVYRVLQAKILLSREYTKNGNLILLDIINSDRRKSFHDPKICFSVRWNIVKDEVVNVPVKTEGINHIYVNVLYLSNKKDPRKRLVAMYWFMFKGSESITMFRVVGFVKNNYSETLKVLENFTSDLMGLVYKNVEKPKPLLYKIVSYGFTGYLIIATVFLVPTAMIGYGSFELRRKLRN